MTNVERRFTTAMREADSDDPGLIQEDDGTVWLVDPDGTRTQLPGTGGGLPAGGSTGEVLTKASNADGDADWEAGGGSQPAGSNGEIQFNDGGTALGASPSLAWDESVGLTVASTLVLSNNPNTAADIACDGLGVQLFIAAADGDASHVGGEVNIKAGDSDGNNGGDLTIEAGRDTADGTGGNVTIASGRSAEADGGEISIIANPGVPVPGDGGQVLITAGAGDSGGGSVLVQGGSTDGTVQLYSGDSNRSIELSNARLYIGAPIVADALPTADPHVANHLWVDPAAGFVIKVSQG